MSNLTEKVCALQFEVTNNIRICLQIAGTLDFGCCIRFELAFGKFRHWRIGGVHHEKVSEKDPHHGMWIRKYK